MLKNNHADALCLDHFAVLIIVPNFKQKPVATARYTIWSTFQITLKQFLINTLNMF